MVRAVYLGQRITVDWDQRLIVTPPDAQALVEDAIEWGRRSTSPVWTPTGPGVPYDPPPGTQEWDVWVAWCLQHADSNAQVPRPVILSQAVDGLVY
jgi:hypothetical protein